MKISLWFYIQNLGDGSCSCRIFDSKKAAEHYASFDNERNCDDIYEEIIYVDNTGKLLSQDFDTKELCEFINPIHYSEEYDE